MPAPGEASRGRTSWACCRGTAVPMYVLGGCNLAAACILLCLHVPPKPAELRGESAGSFARAGSAEEALRQGQESSAELTQAR